MQRKSKQTTKKQQHEEKEEEKKEHLSVEEMNTDEVHSIQLQVTSPVNDPFHPYKYCHTCRLFRDKSLKIHHCATCDNCIIGFDHHCVFLGTCIGANNHRSFYSFLIFCLLGCTFMIISSIHRIASYGEEESCVSLFFCHANKNLCGGCALFS